MLLYNRSSGFSGGGDVSSGPGGGLEGPGAGLSAGAETHLATSVEGQFSSFDVRGAHQFFQPGGSESAALMTRLPQGIELTVAQAAPMATGAEAAALAGPMPTGMESALTAPIVPGANEISPMIQLIMKLPGAMGLLNSFFEALAALFAPQQSFMQLLDPTVWAANLKSALTTGLHPGVLPGAEHASISLSLLPSSAHIFQTMGLNGQHLGMGLDGVYGKMAPHLGNTSFNTVSSEHLGAIRDQFKVSGQLDLNKPQYEMGSKLAGRSELVSGPSLSDSPPSTHLSGNQRIFSDRSLSSALSNNNSNNPLSANTTVSATNTPPVATSLSQSLPLSPPNDGSLANFNVSDSAFSTQPEALPAVASAGDGTYGVSGAQNVGFNANDGQGAMKMGSQGVDASQSGFGPSGMVGKDLIAFDKGNVETFHPTLGSTDSQWAQPQSVATPSYPAQPKVPSAPLNEGLKAKQLSLESVKNSHTARPVMDHFGYQTKAGHTASQVRGGGTMDGISHRHLPKAYGASARPNFAARSNPQDAVPVEPQPQAMQMQPDIQQQSFDGQQLQGTDAQTQAVGADGQIAQSTDGAIAAPSQYTIRSGDCLWNIAKDHLGNGLKWQEIYKMNSDVLGSNPDLIYPGTSIQLPGGSDIASGALESGKYVVKPGDNLWDISRELLGDGTKWGDLYKANIDVIGDNPRLILPGQELTIPSGGGDLVASAGQTSTQAAAQGAQQTASAATSSPSVPTASTAAAPSSDLAAQAPQTPVDSYANLPDGGMSQPGAQIEAPQMAPPVKPAVNTAPAGGPGAAGGQQLTGGPGAAEAATLEQADASLPMQQAQQQVSDAPQGYANVQSHKSVVSSSLAADLTTILQRRK